MSGADDSTVWLESGVDEPGTELSRGSFLFGDHTLIAYRESMLRGIERVERSMSTAERPFTGIAPAELAAYFDAVDLDEPVSSVDEALRELDTLYLRDAVYFHHPRYVAHLNCPIAVPALLGELIASALNTSVDTWDQSAGATLVEQRLIAWTARRIGFGNQADGVFTSGGTQSNLMALLLARDIQSARRRRGHDSRRQGLAPGSDRFRILTSELCHFSVQKAAAILGLGHEAIVSVPTDPHFRMDVDALGHAIAECEAAGREPIAVVATAGTTDFGTIDPISPIADICRNHDLWLHVDAAYGCGLLVSERHRTMLTGIEHADSVTVDYHKSFFQPVSCSALVVRQGCHLGCVTWHADYLNPESQRREGTPNLVDKSLQTTRRFDALKLWLTLRTMGPDGIGHAFDQVIALARDVYRMLLADAEFELVHQPVLSTLVFRFRPVEDLGNETLDRINSAIRKRLWRTGEAVVAGTRFNGQTWLKFTLLNPATTVGQVAEVLERIREQGHACTDSTDPAT